MKRADRLMAILIALQQRPQTAQILADKFEVSKRTILRDMQSLSEMGIPLYALTGPSGGFRIMEGFQLPPLQIDDKEALTVLFALRAMTRITDTPFNQARWTVMDKIAAILPKQTVEQIEPVLEHVEVKVPKRSVKVPYLNVLIEQASDFKWLHVLYRSEKHHRWLKLLPQKIHTAHGFWYCEAYSATHGEYRVFRVDRFESVEIIVEPSKELTNQVRHQEEQTEHKKSPIRIVAKLTYRGALLAEQDEHVGECVKQVSDEQWEIDFECPASDWLWAVRFFFNIGLDAEVVTPHALRDAIYAQAVQLLNRYNPTNENEEAKDDQDRS